MIVSSPRSRLYACLIALGVASLSANAQAGNILISGGNMNATIQTYLGAFGDTSTIASPSSFGTTSFSGYSAIWLGSEATFTGLSSRQADFTSFLNAGGNVLIEVIPGFNNPLGDYPMGGSLVDANTNVQTDSVHIIAPGNPVNAGLTDAGLSGWSESIHDYFTSIDGFTGLTTDGNPAHFVTIEKTVGLGHLIYTGQDISYHIQNGSGGIGPTSAKGVFVNNVLSLAPSAAVPEPGSMTLLGVGLAVVSICGRRRLRRRAS